MITVEERWRLNVPYDPPSPWRAHAWAAGILGGIAVLLFIAYRLADGTAAAMLGIAVIVALAIAGTAAAAGAVRTVMFRSALQRPPR